MDITFIGTSSGIPTKSRGLPCVAVRVERIIVLLDCGEGAQLGFLRYGLGTNKPMVVVISHLHGDHVYGLPPLLRTFSMLGREAPVTVIGPRGIKEYLETALFLTPSPLSYDLEIIEVCGSEHAFDYRGWGVKIKLVKTEHTVDNYSVIVEEPPKPGKFNVRKAEELGILGPLRKELQRGRPVRLPNGRVVMPHEVVGKMVPGIKLVYSGDTAPSDKLVKAARKADVLIHEATFTSEYREHAHRMGHSTALDAAKVAQRARVGMLILTHISPRYEGREYEVLQEALSTFGCVILARDGLRISIARRCGGLDYVFEVLC